MERDIVAQPTQPDSICIPNFPSFKSKLQSLIRSGTNNLQLISDFDLTLTRYKTGDIRGCSTYQLLQSSALKGGSLAYVQSLFNHYHPIEIDPSVPAEEKERLMAEWWSRSNQALLDEGFHEYNFLEYIQNSTMYFRHGIQQLISLTHTYGVPFTIISGGIGNLIEESLKIVDKDLKNFQIFSNYVEFDEEGKSKAFRQPEIRTDKSKVLVGVEVRKNVIMFGDLITDIRMVEPVEYEHCLKIGFMNDLDVYDIKQYQEVFDAIVMTDGNLTFINYLISTIAGEHFDLTAHPGLEWIHHKMTGS